MWYRLSLRARILLGYGAGLLVMGGLVGLLIFRLEQLNTIIADLNASSAAEAQVGARLAGHAALAQQAVNRYLQQPQASYRQQAAQALDDFRAEISSQQHMLASPAQQARITTLEQDLAAYDATFRTLDTLLDAQNSYRFDTSRYILETTSLTNRFISDAIGGGDASRLKNLVITQSNLQSASAATSRMIAEQNPQIADLAMAGLKLAQSRLQGLADASGGDLSMRDALVSATSAISATDQLTKNLTGLQQIRTTHLVERSKALQEGADAIAQGALSSLTEGTADLEWQVRATEQDAGLALFGALLITTLMGVRLAQALTKPLNELVGATERINQGDYGQPVTEREGGEVGRLVVAFNQMTAALRQQRGEVARQHGLMAERNQELEQALARLQSATAEREQLVSTVNALSVPVIPIMEHVIVVPLVGELDRERAQTLLQRLLDGVVAQRARMAILDITGVAMIDASGASWLLQAARAVELLGARTILAGTSPEVAQALVASGADLGQLAATTDLRAAIEFAVRRLGRRPS